MKTYVITLSKRFPTGHNRAGEPTHFWEKFIKGRDNYSCIYRDFLGNYDSKNPHDTCELPTLEETYRRG